MNMLLLLIGCHVFGDYPLQTEYMALSKSRHDPRGMNGKWIHSLTAHAFIHGFLVGIVTQSIVLGAAEFVAHWVIDFFKCENKYDLHFDQALHLCCKIVWWAIWMHFTLP